MTETKWTSGPWRKLPGKHSNHYVIVAGDYADEGEPDLHVEVVTANPADANIIAAAPDLYEALQDIIDNEMPDYKAAEEFGGYVLDDSLREKALRALRKAWGWRST